MPNHPYYWRTVAEEEPPCGVLLLMFKNDRIGLMVCYRGPSGRLVWIDEGQRLCAPTDRWCPIPPLEESK